MSSRDTAYSKLDQIYIDNLSVDEGSVVDVKALRNRARAEVQPTLFDLGAVNQLGYGPPPIDILMDEGDKKFSGQLVEAAGRGTTKLIGGTVGDLLGIAKGLYNIPQDQMDQLMVKMEDPAVQQEVISKFDSFMKGFEDIKALDLPPGIGMTSEAVGEKLTEMGIDPQGEADSELKKKVLGAVELGTEIINPIGLGAGVAVTKGVKSGAKLVKKSFKKTNKMQGFSDSFSDWFDRSKIVDTDNQPLVLYHGTTNTFDTFKRPSDIKNVKRGGIVATDGIFFTANPNTANSYARKLGLRNKAGSSIIEGAQVKPVYLNIENPYVINEDSMPNKLRKFITEMRGNYYSGDANQVANKEQIDNLIAKGYDGIIIKRKPTDWVENRNEYIAFNDNQILSALSDIVTTN